MDFNRFEQRISNADRKTPHYDAFIQKNAAKLDNETKKRVKNVYDIFDEAEVKRLEYQRSLLRKSDIRHISRLVDGRTGLTLIDIGCNDGGFIKDRVASVGGVEYALGLDINNDRIVANVMQNDLNDDPDAPLLVDYACVDAESSDFVDKIAEIYGGTLIQFDIVVISMVLLHTSDDMQVLKNAKAVLKDGGKIFIRDMDDGLTVAYPDKNNVVPQLLEYSLKATAYRHEGRRIPKLLSDCGFRNIGAWVESPDTIGANMTQEERDMLCSINFDYIPIGVKRRADRKERGITEEDVVKCDKLMRELRDMFKVKGFFYNMGCMTFTAEK